MELKLETMTAARVAYIRRVGPYGADNAETMEALKNWARQNDLLNDDAVILGIALDNPETTKPENCRYDTCIVVSDSQEITGDRIREGSVEGGKYVVFTVEHTAEAVGRAWMEIFPELINRGYQMDPSRPILERYAAQMVNRHLCEICVPIC